MYSFCVTLSGNQRNRFPVHIFIITLVHLFNRGLSNHLGVVKLLFFHNLCVSPIDKLRFYFIRDGPGRHLYNSNCIFSKYTVAHLKFSFFFFKEDTLSRNFTRSFSYIFLNFYVRHTNSYMVSIHFSASYLVYY